MSAAEINRAIDALSPSRRLDEAEFAAWRLGANAAREAVLAVLSSEES